MSPSSNPAWITQKKAFYCLNEFTICSIFIHLSMHACMHACMVLIKWTKRQAINFMNTDRYLYLNWYRKQQNVAWAVKCFFPCHIHSFHNIMNDIMMSSFVYGNFSTQNLEWFSNSLKTWIRYSKTVIYHAVSSALWLSCSNLCIYWNISFYNKMKPYLY